MNLQVLVALRKYLTVNDHKDGKITLNYSLKVLSDSDAMEMIKDIKNHKMPKAILDSDLNIFASTVLIKYDTNYLEPTEFEEFFTTDNQERFDELVTKYTDVLSN